MTAPMYTSMLSIRLFSRCMSACFIIIVHSEWSEPPKTEKPSHIYVVVS